MKFYLVRFRSKKNEITFWLRIPVLVICDQNRYSVSFQVLWRCPEVSSNAPSIVATNIANVYLKISSGVVLTNAETQS